jgi:hypothetical protein
VVRASAAAPHYFAPEPIAVAAGEPPGLFVDGAVTAHNNPALGLLQLATLPPYGYSWPTGAEKVLIVSVGTGMITRRLDPVAAARMRALSTALTALTGMMDEVNLHMLTLMQALGRTDTPWQINRELGDLAGFILPKEPLFTFQRY